MVPVKSLILIKQTLQNPANNILGDIRTFESFFRSHYQGLCMYAHRYMKDTILSEEVVQDTFVALWEKRENIRLSGSFTGYIYSAVHNRCINRLKQEKTYRETLLNSVPDDSVCCQPEEGEEYPEPGIPARINSALDKLPTQCRKIFEMSRFEQKKYREIAEELNISIKTVENQMGKALKTLRDELSDVVFIIMILFWMN